jgi:heme/copper-type cytochrome/quinol oxidase subunit 1
MPRRVYDASYNGHPAAAVWQAWTGVSALGGVVLFVSAMFFVLVAVATIAVRSRGVVPVIEYAETVEPAPTRR